LVFPINRDQNKKISVISLKAQKFLKKFQTYGVVYALIVIGNKKAVVYVN
jgi:hypothetical protein